MSTATMTDPRQTMRDLTNVLREDYRGEGVA
jgi:hypothetical protein